MIQYSRWLGSSLQSLEISFSWKIFLFLFLDGLDIVGGDHVPQRSLSCSVSQVLAGLGQRHHQVSNQNCHNHQSMTANIISCCKVREYFDISRLRLREDRFRGRFWRGRVLLQGWREGSVDDDGGGGKLENY